MKKLFLSAALFSTLAFAETFTGNLIDTMCQAKDPAEHTTQCAIGCAKSGYGLVMAGGKFVKLDDAGNTKALAALKDTKKEKGVTAKVTGSLKGGTIQVESLVLD